MTAAPSPPWPPVPEHPDLAGGTVDLVWIELGSGDRRADLARREVLGHYLGSDPGSLAIDPDKGGKPRLAGNDSLRFNLSHSGGAALCALSVDLEVGADLEIRHRRVDESRVARRVLGQAAARRLEALPAEDREREFLLAWVRHEAAQKCLGVGVLAPSGVADPAGPWVTAWTLGPRSACALACEREPDDVRRWTWPRR